MLTERQAIQYLEHKSFGVCEVNRLIYGKDGKGTNKTGSCIDFLTNVRGDDSAVEYSYMPKARKPRR